MKGEQGFPGFPGIQVGEINQMYNVFLLLFFVLLFFYIYAMQKTNMQFS